MHRYDEQLRHLEQSRQAAYGGLDQHLKLLAETQQRLQQETGNLVNALKAPAVRGRWGSASSASPNWPAWSRTVIFLSRNRWASSDGRLRPDMVVQLPGGRQIIVDAKTVLGGYLEAHEAADEERRQEGLRRHAAQVRLRINDLSLKAYWSQFDQAPEFVVLFLPGEQFLGAALEQDPVDRRRLCARCRPRHAHHPDGAPQSRSVRLATGAVDCSRRRRPVDWERISMNAWRCSPNM